MQYPEDPRRFAAPGGIPAQRHRAWHVLGGLLVLAPVVLSVGVHNHLVSQREAVDAAWAQVESQYQRRGDLVPALARTIQRYLRHESDTLVGVVRARAEATARLERAAADLAAAQEASARELRERDGRPPRADADLERFARSQERVGLGLQRLLAVAEAHPTLRSGDQFLELQAQLEGTENRINVARMRFNDAVRAYNAAIEKLPARLIATAQGYERRAYFHADAGARIAPPIVLD
jgi:LemA protein